MLQRRIGVREGWWVYRALRHRWRQRARGGSPRQESSAARIHGLRGDHADARADLSFDSLGAEGQVSPAGYWPADAHRGAIRGPSGRQKRGVTSSGLVMRSSLRTTVSTHGEGIGWTLPTHVGRGAELD